MLLLALFYLVIDVWRWKWIAFPFVPIGMNAIAIYLAQTYVEFGHTSQRVFGGLSSSVGAAEPIVSALGVLIVEWCLLFYLYRKRIFIRV